MESSTQVLRRLLDERGVEYKVSVENGTGFEHVTWHPNKFSQWTWNEEFGAGWLAGWQQGVTPEQAIAATLGNDEIDELKDDYCTLIRENKRLRSCLSDDAENAKLIMSENARLRKLVRDMYACIRYANEQDWFYFERDKPGCGMSCVVNGEGCGLSVLANRMRELGVEVDE